MPTVNATIEIAAPIEQVWATVMDPARLGDWVTIHKSVSGASRAPLRRGATMEQGIAVRGVTFHVHWTLVAMDEPEQAEWEGLGPAHSRARIGYLLKSPRTAARCLSTPTSSTLPVDVWGMPPAGSSSGPPPSVKLTSH